MNFVKTKAPIAKLLSALFIFTACSHSAKKENMIKTENISLMDYRKAAATHFEQLDKDHNGSLESQENEKALQEKLKIIDKNKDRKTQYDEYMKEVNFEFYRRDQNHDGNLSSEELKKTGSDFNLYKK